MTDLDKRLQGLCTERVRDPAGSWRVMTPLEVGKLAARMGAEAAYEDAARWITDPEAWPVGRVPPAADLLAVADDIRAHALRVLGLSVRGDK